VVGALLAEDEVDDQGVKPVKTTDERHHDDDEDENNDGERHQLASRWGDNLAKLRHDLPNEQGQATEGTTFLRTLFTSIRDDVLRRLVDDVACHVIHLPDCAPAPSLPRVRRLQGGQDSNLQPAVLETAALPIEPPPFERNHTQL
jgi:hypothetical protein